MGAFFGKLIGKSATSALAKTPLRPGLTGALGEAAQEFGQSGAEQLIANKTVIEAGDVLVLNHLSGGTAGAYMLNAQCAAGSASINVRNATAGNLSEAIVIRFAVIKAVSA
jgi:hypothetical protein